MANKTARYIDANGIRWHYRFGIDDPEYGMCVPIADVKRSIAETPTADVQEVRHGRWAVTENQVVSPFCRLHELMWICSECDFPAGKYYYIFCPKCGAKMDQEGEAEK